MPVYKDLHFNRDLSATKKLQAGVDLVARLLGVTLGPKGRNVVLGNKYGPPKIVNDGETVLKEVTPCFQKLPSCYPKQQYAAIWLDWIWIE